MIVKRDGRSSPERTRTELVDTARELFLERGYSQTSVAEIVDSAGVTKGALYHHFRDKEEIFRAVLEEMYGDLLSSLEAAARAQKGRRERVEAMARRYLERCADPGFAGLALSEAPAVLGWKEWCRLTARHGTRAFARELRAATREGMLRAGASPDDLAQVILGTLDTAARVASDGSSSAAEAGEKAWRTVEKLLEGVWRPGPEG